jgi:hypothetical protein
VLTHALYRPAYTAGEADEPAQAQLAKLAPAKHRQFFVDGDAAESLAHDVGQGTVARQHYGQAGVRMTLAQCIQCLQKHAVGAVQLEALMNGEDGERQRRSRGWLAGHGGARSPWAGPEERVAGE